MEIIILIISILALLISLFCLFAIWRLFKYIKYIIEDKQEEDSEKVENIIQTLKIIVHEGLIKNTLTLWEYKWVNLKIPACAAALVYMPIGMAGRL